MRTRELGTILAGLLQAGGVLAQNTPPAKPAESKPGQYRP